MCTLLLWSLCTISKPLLLKTQFYSPNNAADLDLGHFQVTAVLNSDRDLLLCRQKVSGSVPNMRLIWFAHMCCLPLSKNMHVRFLFFWSLRNMSIQRLYFSLGSSLRYFFFLCDSNQHHSKSQPSTTLHLI